MKTTKTAKASNVEEIKRLLNKPVDNFSWLKDVSEEAIDLEIAALDPKPTLNPNLRVDQKVCFLLGVSYPHFFSIIDLGLGKTVIALELLKYFYTIGRIKKWSLVLAPTEEIVHSWADEIRKWGFPIPYVLLLGSSKEKWGVLQDISSGAIIGTYVGTSIMCSELRQTNKGKKKHILVSELVERIVSNTDCLVCDQSTAIGNPTSLSYEATKCFSRKATIRYNLAGRPFARDPLLLWAQFYVLDRGLTLSPSYGLFREAFFDKKKSWFGGPGNFDYKFIKALQPQLSRLIGHRSIQYSRAECLNLPLKTYIKRTVPFPADMHLQYRQVIDEVLGHHHSYLEMQNAFIRMRQICSGFVTLKGEEDKLCLDFKVNPKLDLLLELIDEMPEDSKAIIFYEFTHSAEIISKALIKKKMKHGWLWSGTKNWPEMKKKFDTDPDFRILINQWRKGGMGLNLQVADYTFYYESPVSSLDREESEGRNWRGGQTKPVTYYDLVISGSVEEQILTYHREGNDLFKALVTDPQRVLLAA